MQPELKLIIDLVSDTTNLVNIKISNLSEDKIIKLLVDNQVMLPFLKNLEKLPNSELQSIKKRIKKIIEKDYVLDFDSKTVMVLSFLNDLKVGCMMHKYLFFEREQGDIDILVPIEKFDHVIEFLKKKGFVSTSHESYKIGMTNFENNSKFTIHVHSKIKWESEFISTNDVWERAREIKFHGLSVLIPSAEDSILIECAHAFFESSLIRLCDVLQFLELLKRETINWQKITSRLIEYHYQSAGYLYLLAINQLAQKLYDLKPIPTEVFAELEKNISKLERILAVNHARRKILSNAPKSVPLSLSLVASAILFISFNKRLGVTKFIWSLGVIFLAVVRHVEVKLGLRKL